MSGPVHSKFNVPSTRLGYVSPIGVGSRVQVYTGFKLVLENAVWCYQCLALIVTSVA